MSRKCALTTHLRCSNLILKYIRNHNLQVETHVIVIIGCYSGSSITVLLLGPVGFQVGLGGTFWVGALPFLHLCTASAARWRSSWFWAVPSRLSCFQATLLVTVVSQVLRSMWHLLTFCFPAGILTLVHCWINTRCHCWISVDFGLNFCKSNQCWNSNVIKMLCFVNV